MTKVKSVGIIRDRGQVTIPDEIRKTLAWVIPSSVVTISVESPDAISIQPHQDQPAVDWGVLWNSIRLSRSLKGKRGNLAQFIAEDRQNRP